MESYSGWGLSPATGQTKTVSLLLEYCWSETENWGYNYISSYLSFFNHPFTTDWGCTPSNIALLVYYAYNHIYINQYMVVSSNGGSQKPLVLILNCFNLGWLVPPWLRKPPYIHTYIHIIYIHIWKIATGGSANGSTPTSNRYAEKAAAKPAAVPAGSQGPGGGLGMLQKIS